MTLSKPTFIKIVDLKNHAHQINIELISSHKQGDTSAFIYAGTQEIVVSAADYQSFLEKLAKVSFVV